MKNKQSKNTLLLTTKALLTKRRMLCGPVGEDSYYLDWCEYDGQLKVFQHFEEPRPICEGVVGQGVYKLGVVSLSGSEMKGE